MYIYSSLFRCSSFTGTDHSAQCHLEANDNLLDVGIESRDSVEFANNTSLLENMRDMSTNCNLTYSTESQVKYSTMQHISLEALVENSVDLSAFKQQILTFSHLVTLAEIKAYTKHELMKNFQFITKRHQETSAFLTPVNEQYASKDNIVDRSTLLPKLVTTEQQHDPRIAPKKNLTLDLPLNTDEKTMSTQKAEHNPIDQTVLVQFIVTSGFFNTLQSRLLDNVSFAIDYFQNNLYKPLGNEVHSGSFINKRLSPLSTDKLIKHRQIANPSFQLQFELTLRALVVNSSQPSVDASTR